MYIIGYFIRHVKVLNDKVIISSKHRCLYKWCFLLYLFLFEPNMNEHNFFPRPTSLQNSIYNLYSNYLQYFIVLYISFVNNIFMKIKIKSMENIKFHHLSNQKYIKWLQVIYASEAPSSIFGSIFLHSVYVWSDK